MDALLDEQREHLLLDGYRRFLEHFLEEGSDTGKAARELAHDYFKEKIPFVLLMGSFNHIKEKLIQLAASNTGQPLERYRKIEAVFERAKRETARNYLIHEASNTAALPKRIVREKTLIRIYLAWMERVRSAIVGDLAQFPLEAADDSEFSRALRYPESMLICLDLKLCDQILDQHRLIFQQASILYAMLSAHRHEQAYVAYQELEKKVAELLNLLSVLYFEGQTNRIGRFFNFLQASLYLPGRKFLCVINLRQLDKINKLYGNEVGNRALERIDNALREEFEQHQSWMVYTPGIAGDFYVVGYDTEPEAVEELLGRVHRKIFRQQHTDMPVEIEIVHHGIELTNLNDLTTENMHLLVLYLTEQARKAPRHVATGEEHTNAMLEWLKHQHHRSLDLRAKLTEESTDIFIQPLVTLDDKRHIHAFEVLGRFREGDGYISAGLFIDDIIQMGLSADFDRLVLRAIVRHAQDLARITPRLFINVSSASLENPDYLEALIQAIGGPLKKFEVILELTEQVLLERRELVYELHRNHGVAFAIDDFGTGYSTLQIVIELALEGSIRYLKLDGSLTRNITTSVASERIMHITQQMARDLGLETVVEFIETAAQATKLEALEMDLGQGYLLGVPDPVPVWRGKINYLQSKRPTAGMPVFTL